MRYIFLTASAGLLLSLSPQTQHDSAAQPKVSSDPLSSEQIDVYRAVLEDYKKDDDSTLNLANITVPLDQFGSYFDKPCTKGIKLEAVKSSAQVIHRLDAGVAFGPKFLLVDPNRQEEKIRENDPGNLVKQAIDDHKPVTEEQIGKSVKQAFESGLFTLSEVGFDKNHRRALVAYSFVCGGLCGHGNALVLKKVGQKWRVSKTCGGWVS
jgi:hypothetical protein